MIKIIALGLTLAIVIVAHVTGFIRATDLSHPFWHNKATLVGSGLGALLAMALLWLQNRIVTGVAAIGLVVAIVATSRAASIFINSADYEPFAGKIWFFGYHATVALFVALVTVGIHSILKRRASTSP